MVKYHCVMWVLPSGVQLGFRVSEKAPIVCMVCLEDPGKEPLEFPSIDQFVRHLLKEHRSCLNLAGKFK